MTLCKPRSNEGLKPYLTLVPHVAVIFVDADAIVVSNMDEVFRCPGFCATLRHSERFNSGVMALTPNAELFKDMIAKTSTLQSYTGCAAFQTCRTAHGPCVASRNATSCLLARDIAASAAADTSAASCHPDQHVCRGDQGFLNAYWPKFIDSALFDPEADYNDTELASMLLPTRYNADIGLYVVNSNRWLLGGKLKVVHYTFGGFKPWDWWCGWLIEEQTRWNVRICACSHML